MLKNGQVLSYYKILGPLGAGGMGEVYRALDTRLEREVAIKVLPQEMADSRERLIRFEREAKTLATLNHTNIAGIYGVDRQDEISFLALELVPGEDLETLLDNGPLAVPDALNVCRQLAEGLEVAHEADIVHRDLKPANIRVTPDGVVKILDFGLAKPMHPRISKLGGSTAQTDSFLMTQEGRVLGTPTYMSPEQARGKPVDKRTDIWAYGCVLYECLAGRRAFAADGFGELMAEILKQEVDWSALPKDTPQPVRKLLERCLSKDPRTRLRDIGEARILLAADQPPQPSQFGATTSRSPAFQPWMPWSLCAILGVLLLSLGSWPFKSTATQASGLPEAGGPSAAQVASYEPKSFGRQVVFNARFMPDEQTIVYSSALTGNRPKLFILPPSSKVPREISPAGTHLLSVSKTGELAVLTDTTYINHRVLRGTLARMAVDGAPRALVESVSDADWGPEGELAIVRRESGHYRLEYPPGNLLFETSGYVSEPRVSPDGTKVAFLDHAYPLDDRGWVKLVDLSGALSSLTEEYYTVEGLAWAPGGERLHYAGANSETMQLRQPFSVTLDGAEPQRLGATAGDVLPTDMASDGRWLMIRQEIFYGVALRVPGEASDRDLSWLDQSWSPSLFPDRKTLAFSNGNGGPNYSVVTRSLDGSAISTLGAGESAGISADGSWSLAVLSSPPAIMLYPTGVGTPRQLDSGTVQNYLGAEWFPDGKSVLILGREAERPPRAFRLSLEGGPPTPVTPEGVVGRLSPEGERILARDSQGNWWVYPLDLGAPKAPRGLGSDDTLGPWSTDGTSVYVYREGDAPQVLTKVNLETGERTPSITVGPQDQVGLLRTGVSNAPLDPGQTFSYRYYRQLSSLFLVEMGG